MCGEHPASVCGAVPDAGSAPHVRGTRHSGSETAELGRFSPACAGNTYCELPVSTCNTVQPRMCGEHGSPVSLVRIVVGSAPHVRGTHLSRDTEAMRVRFSPACAGNTIISMAGGGSLTVQPRMCGEHLVERDGNSKNFGSAPHVRGTHNLPLLTALPDRFSPACAGNTPVCHSGCAGSAVQPRMCGEHTRAPRPICTCAGSAPHVRGTRWH